MFGLSACRAGSAIWLLSIQRDADLGLGVDALFDTREHAGPGISMRMANALYSATYVFSDGPGQRRLG
jgi:hypothetical protein